MKKCILFFFLIMPFFLTSQVITVNYDSDKSKASLDGMNIGEVAKQRMKEGLAGLIWHYTVVSDGIQIEKYLDSLTQRCNAENSSTYLYKEIRVKDDDKKWNKYGLLNSLSDANIIYRILESKEQGEWVVDYKSTKNILGFTCYKAINDAAKKKWAWVTLDLAFSLSPFEQCPFPGVILEYFDGSTTYIAKNIVIDNETKKLAKFNTAIYSIKTLKSFSDFGEILMNNGEKISSDMFRCIEENE